MPTPPRLSKPAACQAPSRQMISAPVANTTARQPRSSVRCRSNGSARSSASLALLLPGGAGAADAGADTTAPYSFLWTAVPAGCYDIGVRAIDDLGGTATDEVDITVGAGCDGQSPFHGVPAAIPGIIQAEEFGIDSTNVDTFTDTDDPNIQRFLGITPEYYAFFGEQVAGWFK